MSCCGGAYAGRRVCKGTDILDLSYSEEQILLRESAARFLTGAYVGKKPADAWQKFAELGWLALPFSESDGGLGGGPVETALLMETFGAALVTEPYVATALLAGGLIARLGDDSQRALLAEICEGGARLAFAHGEAGARGEPAHVNTTARKADEGWLLEGRKIAVLGGGLAGTFVVSARVSGAVTDRDGIGLFLVPADAAGMDVLGYAAVDGRDFADITLSGVKVDAAARLQGDALPAIEAVLDNATVALCADALGALCVLVDATVDYAKTRVQFGRPIGNFQALQHRMADMAVLREEAKSAVLLGVLKADAPPAERARAASAAKAKLGRAARFIGQQAVQIHGGMGVTEELNIGAYFKRLTVFEILFGSTEFHLRRYAKLGLASGILGKSLLTAPAPSRVLQDA